VEEVPLYQMVDGRKDPSFEDEVPSFVGAPPSSVVVVPVLQQNQNYH